MKIKDTESVIRIIKMKAYNLYGISDLRYEDVQSPEIKDDEVLLEVEAAGICGSDIPRIFTTGTYHFPTIPGHEFAGKVEEVGDAVAANWKGKRVGVFPLIPCKKCLSCINKKYEMCTNYSYLGSRTDGGFAEYVAVPEWNLIELPDSVSSEQAAMLEPMAVAVHAMRSIVPKIDDYIVVHGLGTIGIFLTMFLLEMGCRNVIVIGNKDFQKKTCLKMGIFDECYVDAKEDLGARIMSLTNDKGADVYFECVGKNESILAAINCLAPAGKVQLVGNPASDILLDKDIYWKILRRQLTVKGSWNSSFTHMKDDDWNYVLEKLAQGKVHPEKFITQKFAFDNLRAGLEIMKDKTEDYIKVMLKR